MPNITGLLKQQPVDPANIGEVLSINPDGSYRVKVGGRVLQASAAPGLKPHSQVVLLKTDAGYHAVAAQHYKSRGDVVEVIIDG